MLCITQASTAVVVDMNSSGAAELVSTSWPTKWPLSANPVKFFNNLESTLGEANSFSS